MQAHIGHLSILSRNFFPDIHNFTMTQENYAKAPNGS